MISSPSTPSDFAALEQAHRILSTLPRAHFAFAYGSAVVPQRDVEAAGRMIDLVVVVDDAETFHQENLARNPSHYAFPMSFLGANTIARLQTSAFGARVYFNTVLSTMSTMSRPSFKYGVVTLTDFVDDLRTWRSLYLAGRLHKPVHFLTHPCDRPPPSLRDALSDNLEAAAAAALLILPPCFSDLRLYTALAGLSYTGDVRHALPFESLTKVSDIVSANLTPMHALYASSQTLQTHLQPLRPTLPDRPSWTRDTTPLATSSLLNTLPAPLRRHVHTLTSHSNTDPNLVSRAVSTALSAVILRSSLAQSIKGLATAGLPNSLRYLSAKLRKALHSRLRTHSTTKPTVFRH